MVRFFIIEENDLSRRDLIRFAHYDLRLFSRYKACIHTVVLTPSDGTPGTKVLDTGTLQDSVLQLVLEDRYGDKLLAQVQSALAKGLPVNELELIFLPLMESRLGTGELLRRTIELENHLPEPDVRSKVRELTLILADRIVDRNILDELWEELRMFKVIKYAEDKGMEKGMKKGREEERKTVAKNLLSLGMGDDFVMKATGLDKKIINALKKTLTPSV